MLSKKVQVNIIFIFIPLLLILILVFMASGCSYKSLDEINSSSKDKIIFFSDSSTENLLRALSNKDYERFSKDFDEDLTDYITMERFNAVANSFSNDIGKYIEHSIFLKPKEIDIEGESIYISYKADFLKTPENNSEDRDRLYEVLIVVAFEEHAKDIEITDFRYFSLDLHTCILC